MARPGSWKRWGASGAAAERALQAALLHRSEQEHSTGSDATIVGLAENWLAEVRVRGRAPRTIEQYERTVHGHVVPRLGKLKVRELTPRVVDRVLREVSIEVGPAAARTLRSVLSGMAGIAIRRGELRTNPVRDAAPISQPHLPHSPAPSRSTRRPSCACDCSPTSARSTSTCRTSWTACS